MKAVLLSLQPKWCYLIYEGTIDGKKTIEVRKTRPKIETPFKCYIYCTKPKSKYDAFWITEPEYVYYGNGRIFGEFICDKILVRPENTIYYGEAQKEYLDLLNSACLTESEVIDYMDGNLNKPVYFWHISDLKIYDQPKELSEFFYPECTNENHCGNCPSYTSFGIDGDECATDGYRRVTRLPQSWCYVEEL